MNARRLTDRERGAIQYLRRIVGRNELARAFGIAGSVVSRICADAGPREALGRAGGTAVDPRGGETGTEGYRA